jgi:redox-sensitive bicupin YhaK (pirin superfamily)
MAQRLLSRREVAATLGIGLPAALVLGCGHGESQKLAASTPIDRQVRMVVDAQPSVDGAGVKLRRALGSRGLSMLDPFLLLDEIHDERPEDYQKGFPTHPHRGFETVTYMLRGAMEHQDSLGNSGHLGPGSAQWMTAGRGIVHSEMPKSPDGIWGFQLWVNLPRALKMTKPRYQDIAPSLVRETGVDDASVRVIAGVAGGVSGPVEGIVTAPTFLDVEIAPRGLSRHPLPASHSAFAYVIQGALEIGSAKVNAGQLAVLGEGDRVSFASQDGARLLLFAAHPINEPVARRGPFVMNTEAELDQAVDDYRSGLLVDPRG